MADVAESLGTSKGRGKVVLGFLIYNIGFTVLLDTALASFSLGLIAFGACLLVFGHIQHAILTRKGASPQMPNASMKAAAIFLTVLLSGFSFTSHAAALSPTEQIQQVDQLLKGFHKPAKGSKLSKEESDANAKLKTKILREDFDMSELCRLSLDEHWKALSPAQRQEFVSVFTNLLINNAILHAEKHTGDEKISYLTEENIADFKGRRLVKTKVEVPKEAVDFDVDYAMLKDAKAGRWRIYDLVLDGESLMHNYREQFDLIITSKSYAHLLERMKKRLKEKQSGVAAKGF